MSIRLADGAYATTYETRWGDGMVYVRDGCLVGVDLPGEGPLEAARATGAEAAGAQGVWGITDPPDAADAQALAVWAQELSAYFAGERSTWTAAEVPLAHLGLGPFEQAVYEALLSLPPGETVSYGELAERAGYPRAARAVGNAMAANPIPIVVPCHRVIRSDGTMGNYGNDPAWKPRLLVHEGWSCAGASRAAGPPADGS
jgi:methylated-DNA-[protein]-cysteine S-methyltransferase